MNKSYDLGGDRKRNKIIKSEKVTKQGLEKQQIPKRIRKG